MYYLQSGHEKHDHLRRALLLAAAVHAVAILGISFDALDQPRHASQIDVTLATRPSETAPEEASHVAQADQQGGGEQADYTAVTSRNNDFPDTAETQQEMHLRQIQSAQDPAMQLVSTTALARQAATADKKKQAKPSALPGLNPEVDKLNQELASLEAELDKQTRTYANMPRVRRLTSVAARQSADAAYLQAWLRRLETVGNQYYPEASVRYGIYGSLRLLVVIRQDGSLEDIRVLSSSGYAVLDEAAIKILRMAAPYAPFPPELKATTDRLEIIRTWHFEENGLSSD